VTAAFALSALSALAVAPLAPFLLESLRLSRGQVGLFLPAVYLGGVLMALPAGWLTDLLGVRRTLGLGQALIGAMVALAGLTGSLPLVLGCLVVAGFGFSVANPATGRAIVEWFPARERGMAMGIKQTGLTVGGILGALLLPPLAFRLGWRDALVVAGVLSLASAAAVMALYRPPSLTAVRAPVERPRFGELGAVMRRRGVLVVFGAGFLLSLAQASVLAYLALYARETFDVSPVAAGQLLALAQLGGTVARLVWGVASDRFFGGRRRPGVVITALTGALAYAVLSLGALVPSVLTAPLAFLAGVGAFGWVGLYFALVAEVGGPRYAGLLTGVAVVFAWSGVLVGPLVFGTVLQVSGDYAWSWWGLSMIVAVTALVVARLEPLVQRGRLE
jgi:ACS family hexuronate transporter-like MFS transporter